MKHIYLTLFFYTNLLYSLNMNYFDINKIPIDKDVFIMSDINDKINKVEEEIVKLNNKLNRAIEKNIFKSKEYVSLWLRTTTFENMSHLFNVLPQEAINNQIGESWGYSFQLINSQIHTLLVDIANTYDRTNKRVEVLDLGCGNGWLAPFILMAGGKYRGVEQKKDIANKANTYIWSTKNLWSKQGENAQDLYKIANVNIFNKNAIFKKIKYDVIICNNILHFYKPEQVEEIIGIIVSLLNSNGRLFLIVDAPTNKKLRELYIENQSKNIK